MKCIKRHTRHVTHAKFFDEHIILPMMTNMGIVHRDLFALPSVTRKKGHENYNNSLLLSNNSLFTLHIFLTDTIN